MTGYFDEAAREVSTYASCFSDEPDKFLSAVADTEAPRYPGLHCVSEQGRPDRWAALTAPGVLEPDDRNSVDRVLHKLDTSASYLLELLVEEGILTLEQIENNYDKELQRRCNEADDKDGE